jgi:hypothetical protein
MMRPGVVALLALVVIPSMGYAQAEEPRRPFAWDVARAVLIDPTTYAPAVISYEAMMQDWKTSQVLFRHGWVEANPRFTVTGRPNDRPVDYSTGIGRIRSGAFELVGISAAHNLAVGIGERLLIERYPSRRKLIRTVSWIERITYASVAAYRNSAQHFRQASWNRRLARDYYGR